MTPTSPFTNIPNFRDISTSSPILNPSLLYRSADPSNATPDDQSVLQNTYKIKTIIDLRTDSERLVQKKDLNIPADIPTLRNATDESAPTTPSSDKTAQEIGETLPKTIQINFNGPTYSSAIFAQLTYWNQARLALLYTLGYRTQAIKIIGENVMAHRGLTGLAIDSLKYCRQEIKSIFDILSQAETYPVLIHCTQGKDRTGLVILLVLGLLGVSVEDVKRDYLLSVPGLQGDLEERIKAISSIGLPEEFADCPEELVEDVLGEIDREYGGVEKFLVGPCGVGEDQVERVTDILRRQRGRLISPFE